jgi:hypothetical protein
VLPGQRAGRAHQPGVDGEPDSPRLEEPVGGVAERLPPPYGPLTEPR